MKGTLMKTDQGWVVEHEIAEKTPIGYKSWWGTFPLHPEFIEMMDTCFTSKFTQQVEFEFVTEWENGQVGVNGLTYAKLIHHPVDTNEMIDHIGEANEMVNHVPDVGKMVEDDVVKLAEEYAIKVYHAFEDATWFRPLNLGYYAGYNKAKETLYTEEQVRDAIDRARNYYDGWVETENEIIQSLKQPKQ